MEHAAPIDESALTAGNNGALPAASAELAVLGSIALRTVFLDVQPSCNLPHRLPLDKNTPA
ncbi:MAG: hypothetical protein AB7G25_06065 [Sphingomonadaceae bacterium]